jgi:hypothetical protein
MVTLVDTMRCGGFSSVNFPLTLSMVRGQLLSAAGADGFCPSLLSSGPQPLSSRLEVAINAMNSWRKDRVMSGLFLSLN